MEEGFHFHFSHLQSTIAPDIPLVTTVFSAPDYCGRYGNLGAFVVLQSDYSLTDLDDVVSESLPRHSHGQVTAVQFSEAEHPEPKSHGEGAVNRVQLRLEESCPWMPTTFSEFVKRAIELGEMKEQAAAVLEESAMAPVPPSLLLPSVIEEESTLSGSPPKLPLLLHSTLAVESPDGSGRASSSTGETLEHSASASRDAHALFQDLDLSLGPDVLRIPDNELGSPPPTPPSDVSMSMAMASRDARGSISSVRSKTSSSEERAHVAGSPPTGTGQSTARLLRMASAAALAQHLNKSSGTIEDLHNVSLASIQSAGLDTPKSEGAIREMVRFANRLANARQESPGAKSLESEHRLQQTRNKLFRAIDKIGALRMFSKGSHVFQSAVASDSINEIHPRLVEKKIESAEIRVRMERQRNAAAAQTASADLEATPLPSASMAGSCESVPSRNGALETLEEATLEASAAGAPFEFETGRRRSSLGMASGSEDEGAEAGAGGGRHVQASSRRSSTFSNRRMSTLDDAAAATTTVFDEGIMFTDDQLHSLSVLFMLIDRSGDGLISARELMAWSNDEGEYLSQSNAELCVRAVDSDGDDQIGLDDFLEFAANLKELAEEEEREERASLA